jgi:hypothetical protein
MINDPQRQAIELPAREGLSLCEAVTSVIYGKAVSVEQYQRGAEEHLSKIESQSSLGIFDKPTPANKQIAPDEQSAANEQSAKLSDLLERLREAAYAGRIKFRAIKDYANPADGPREIDPTYFYYWVVFNWPQDEIHLEDESSTVWSCVHLDCEQFQSLLREMDLELRDDVDRTGLQGRPPSIYLLLPEAERRLNAEQHPKGIGEFSRDLATWFEGTHPGKPPLRPRSIENAIREGWREHQKVCTK